MLANLDAGRLDIRFRQGQRVRVPATVTSDGVAIDLTGHALLAQLRRKPGATVAAQFVITTDVVHNGEYLAAVDGELLLGMAEDTTAGLSGRYQWDLLDVTDDVYWLAGVVIVRKRISVP